MTLGPEREAQPWKSICREIVLLDPSVRVTEIVSPATDFWSFALPRKDMDVSYFAETKGVVGCHYSSRVAFNVR